ncbi:Asp-tRNA(Asn)/Glu-tRNA(Gln) amidotransferase subunit GatA [Candidatus Uhrbacteria bacterium]|nr:Asp-tRNA(Asn)/Glu-tRNA(Gln) amidotransferase subunit GatA [Candidatus Uhrbacteria bacterium]
MPTPLPARTIKEVHDGLRNKEFSCREITDLYLRRIEELDGGIHSFLTVTGDEARAQADAVDSNIASGSSIGLLEGVPAALKDNLLVAGGRTTAASKILDSYHGSYDATVVSALRKAKTVFLGKTNLDEFAMGSSTENSAYGSTKNPHDLSCVPGGSSGGSAAAVAADECVYALGSDTGGSIRQPASLCGIVGLKPTYGAVSRSGVIALASSLDQIGPLTKTVEDAAIVFDAIKGPDPLDASSMAAPSKPIVGEIFHSIQGLKIGVPEDYFIDGMDTDVVAAVRAAITQLESLGAKIVPITLPLSKYALAVYYILQPAEASANLARFDGIRYGFTAPEAKNLDEVYRLSRGQGFGQETRRRIMLGTYALAAGYYDAYYKKAQAVRLQVRRDFDNAFREVDCIATPASPVVAFKIGERTDDPLTMYLADVFTVSANIAGIPGLVVPCGYADKGGKQLPIGLQLLGRHFDEAMILRVGYAYEQSTEWHKKTPVLS